MVRDACDRFPKMLGEQGCSFHSTISAENSEANPDEAIPNAQRMIAKQNLVLHSITVLGCGNGDFQKPARRLSMLQMEVAPELVGRKSGIVLIR